MAAENITMEEMFIEIKAAFDKLVQLNDEYGGMLLTDPEAELAEKLEKDARRAAMHDLKTKLAEAKAEKKEQDVRRMMMLEEEMKEKERINDIRRRDVVDRQIQYLHSLRKYEIKMLVKLDKEFSDITYVPTSSLAMQLDILCKRTHTNKPAEDKTHDRPYYNYDEEIEAFDKSSAGKSAEIQKNPELLKQL